MEAISQVQSLVMEHACTIGIGLLIVAVLSGIAWYWMSRGTVQGKSPVLENQARVNSATLDAPMDNVPISALSPEPHTVQNPQSDAEPDQTE